MADLGSRHVLASIARMDYDKQTRQSGSQGDRFSACGPPHWDRNAWEAFRAEYGFYPFGWQSGTRVMPPSFTGAPDWVYDLMEMRRPMGQPGSF